MVVRSRDVEPVLEPCVVTSTSAEKIKTKKKEENFSPPQVWKGAAVEQASTAASAVSFHPANRSRR